MHKYIFLVLLLLSFGVRSECLSEVCGAIEGLELVLINDDLSSQELLDYKRNIETFILDRERHYGELNIDNPELVDLKNKLLVLDQKISLSSCGDTGEIFSGFLKNEDVCYPCMNHNIYPQEISHLQQSVQNIERFIVADRVEEKLADDTLKRIMHLCDEGTAINIRVCIENSFDGDIPDIARDRIDEVLIQRGRGVGNKNSESAGRLNQMMDDLRGGAVCARAISMLQHPDGGLTLRDWSLDSNPLVDIELAFSECSPVKAMELMDRLYGISGPAAWPWGQKEVLREKMQTMYAAQHAMAHKILTEGLNDVGAAALGRPVYDCLSQFPPPQMSNNGSVFTLSAIGSVISTLAGTCDGCMDRRDLLGAKGKCDAFTVDDLQKSRDDAAKLVADELIDKNKARFGRRGNDEKFMAEMARDNAAVLGNILASEGRGCLGHVCQAMLDAQEMREAEDRRAKWRRAGIMVASGATLAIALFAPPSTPVAILALSGATVAIGGFSIYSGAIDMDSKADQIRALKFKLMGREGDVSPEEWKRLQDFEKEFDRLVVELAVEVGLTAVDLIQFGKLVRNMPELVDQLRRFKGWNRAKVDDFLKVCGVR